MESGADSGPDVQADFPRTHGSMDSEIIIVSGLPRSGTSLMMQMLDKGGVEVVTDHIRAADTDNPRGYYEFEQVKKIKEDVTWLPGNNPPVAGSRTTTWYCPSKVFAPTTLNSRYPRQSSPTTANAASFATGSG